MRTIFFAMLVTAGFALVGTSGASAAAANGAIIGKSTQQVNHLIQVRDRCGRHRHWSHRRGRCVRN
jgi:hypothetical protein